MIPIKIILISVVIITFGVTVQASPQWERSNDDFLAALSRIPSGGLTVHDSSTQGRPHPAATWRAFLRNAADQERVAIRRQIRRRMRARSRAERPPLHSAPVPGSGACPPTGCSLGDFTKAELLKTMRSLVQMEVSSQLRRLFPVKAAKRLPVGTFPQESLSFQDSNMDGEQETFSRLKRGDPEGGSDGEESEDKVAYEND